MVDLKSDNSRTVIADKDERRSGGTKEQASGGKAQAKTGKQAAKKKNMASGTGAEVLYKTSKSMLVASDSGVLVMNESGTDRAFTALAVCKGFYIELGRPIKQFSEALNKTRLPIMFQQALKIDDMEQFNLVRIRTGNIPDASLGTIVCNKGIITAISCNKRVATNLDYQAYVQIGSLWRSRIIATTSMELNEGSARKTVLALLRISNQHKVKVISRAFDTKVEVDIIGSGADMTFQFVMNKQGTFFDLVMIKAIKATK